jgi:spore maturation protein CgeB
MLILYAALKYDYGRPEQGFSFEHYNFHDTLQQLGHDLLYFDFGTLHQELGHAGMNRRLQEVVLAEKPALLFCVLTRDEFEPAVLRRISDGGQTTTLNWFCDDHWRFEDFTRRWAPCFNWAVTTAQSALPKYRRLGYSNVIKSQWACNPHLYRRLALPPQYDVTFVGLPHGNRRQVIQAVREAGVAVHTWGQGWEAGRLSQEEMLRVFNQSRINLNLSNASVWRRRHRFLFWRNWSRPRDQIKGRNFEVPGCGGFLLTGRAENLEAYYQDGREIATFTGTISLIDQIRYYLGHEAERARIAEAGYRRTLAEHTYAARFQQIFSRMGLAPQ